MSEIVNKFQREGYSLFGEAKMLENSCEYEFEGKTVIISDLIMKDYRSDKESYNGKHHSVLTTLITISYKDKELKHESKFDTGYPPEGATVESVVANVKGSTGQTMEKVTDSDPVFGARVVRLTAPPSLARIIDLHCWQNRSWFNE